MAKRPEHYSNRVALLRKLLLGLAALGVLALIVGANPTLRDGVANKIQQNFARNGLLAGLMIEEPIFEGRLPNGQNYQLSAQRGQHDDGTIALEKLTLNIAPLATHNGLDLRADSGTITTGSQTAELHGAVRGTDSRGNQFSTDRLQMNIAQGKWLAPHEITMSGATGRLHATRLEADTNSGAYVFDNASLYIGERAPLEMQAAHMVLRDEAQKLTARDRVIVLFDDGRRAEADRAVYDLAAEQMTLSGSVKVTQTGEQASTVTGARLLINMRTGAARLLGEKKGRARIELNNKDTE